MVKILTKSFVAGLALSVLFAGKSNCQEIPVLQTMRPAMTEELTPDQYKENYIKTHPEYKVTGVIVTKKEIARKAEQDRNSKSDAEYKTLKQNHQLPSKIKHPLKRADAWIDYHEDSYRKFRTRTLPATQFAATVIGMGFSIAAGLK